MDGDAAGREPSGRRSRRSGSRRRCWSRSTGRARSSCRRPSWARPARCACSRAGRARPRCAWAAATATRSSRCRTRTTSPTRGRPSARPARRRSRLSRRGARPRTWRFPRISRAGWRTWPRRSATGPRRQPTTIAAVTRALRARHGYTLEPTPGRRRASIRSRASCSASTPDTASCSRRRPCCCCGVRGVPARYVTGFRGGEWNAVGGYVAVRDDRAHAWAEAFLPDRGWVRVDATPPGRAAAARRAACREIIDALDYFWNRWVVGYDLGRQLELARRAGRHLVPPRRARRRRADRRDRGRCVRCWRRCCWPPVACGGVARAPCATRTRVTRSPIWTAPRLGADRAPVPANARAAGARRLAAAVATRRRTSTRGACGRRG